MSPHFFKITERGRLYHKTIAVNFLSRFLKVKNNERPHTEYFGHDFQKLRHAILFVTKALLNAGREANHSQLSAFFSLRTKNSIME